MIREERFVICGNMDFELNKKVMEIQDNAIRKPRVH